MCASPSFASFRDLCTPGKAALTCIDSIVSQLPHLTSLNLSDCPNIRTIAPLASALLSVPPNRGGAVDEDDHGFDLDRFIDDRVNDRADRRRLNLRHLWVRGCDLSSMTRDEWADVFDALAESSGPLERLTLSRDGIAGLHPNVGKLHR